MIYDVCLTRDLARAAAEIYVFIDDLIWWMIKTVFYSNVCIYVENDSSWHV